jgi:hypothetical protein
LEVLGEEAKFVACAAARSGDDGRSRGGERPSEGGSGLEKVTAIHGGEDWNVSLERKCAENQWVKCSAARLHRRVIDLHARGTGFLHEIPLVFGEFLQSGNPSTAMYLGRV